MKSVVCKEQAANGRVKVSCVFHVVWFLPSFCIYQAQELTTSWRKDQLDHEGTVSLCLCIESGVDGNRAVMGFAWEGDGRDIQGFPLVGHGFKNNLEPETPSVFCSTEVS